ELARMAGREGGRRCQRQGDVRGYVAPRGGAGEAGTRHGRETVRPCDLCGQETSSKYGVCNRTPECKQEQGRRRWRAEHPEARDVRDARPCKGCGRPTISKSGRCRRAAGCGARGAGGWRGVPESPCEVCGQPTASKDGVCRRSAECKCESRRR